MTESESLRFGGIARLYGKSALKRFSQSHIMVIGIGGVGTWVAEALARSGIGCISLVDLDDICVTNINRQAHALTSTVGQSKVEVMAQRLLDINPELTIHQIEDFALPDNLEQIIPTDITYVIDCTDAVATKAALIAYCKRHKIKMLTVGGAGGQVDPTQIKVTDLAKTTQDPLASKVRQTLRKDYGFTKNLKRRFQIPCVYSTEQLVYPTQEGEVCTTKQQSDGVLKMDCEQGFGSSTVVTGTFGFVAAAHVLQKIAQNS
tara:strand:- start:789 stop:1571 length:783 start_codon:yes stop_codon:yes gene_type:complete